MKKEDAKYILEAIEWMNEHTTVASVDMETYGNLFMNSQSLLMDVVNGDDKSTEPALHKHIVSNNEVAVCKNCKYFKGGTYHDRMYCRDCRQKDRFLQTDC